MECAQVTENKDYSYGPRPKYGTQAQRLAEPPSKPEFTLTHTAVQLSVPW